MKKKSIIFEWPANRLFSLTTNSFDMPFVHAVSNLLGLLQSLLLLSRFRTLKKCDGIKYVYLISPSYDT